MDIAPVWAGLRVDPLLTLLFLPMVLWVVAGSLFRSSVPDGPPREGR